MLEHAPPAGQCPALPVDNLTSVNAHSDSLGHEEYLNVGGGVRGVGSSGAVSAVPPRLDVVTVLGGWWGPPPLPARRICGLAFPKTPGVGRPPPHHHFSPICDSTFCSRKFCLFVKKSRQQGHCRGSLGHMISLSLLSHQGNDWLQGKRAGRKGVMF